MSGISKTEAQKSLLSFLVRTGKLDREQAARVDQLAQSKDLSVAEAVAQLGLLAEEQLAKALAVELRLPLLNLATIPFDDAATKMVKESSAVRFQMVPVRAEGQTILLAMVNPFDHEAIKHVAFTTGRRVLQAVAPRAQILEAIQHLYKFDTSLRSLLAEIPDSANVTVIREPTPEDQADLRQLANKAEQPPIVKIVNLVLADALKYQASDVHIEPGPNIVNVRFRINGVLEDTLQLPKWVQGPVIARLKVMAKLDITERRVPQDGRLRVNAKDRMVDLRVSSLPTSYGEKIVMRVLDPTAALRKLEGIGFAPRDIEILRAAIAKPEGMVLVTGPTGSGKTTTLYSVIQEIMSPEVNIVTIENPIEYEMKGVSQVEVNEKQGLTFAGALRSILRQDPDVILVGEIRDRETAEVAFHAAQTGHLVLSTLHTNDTAATITRLLDLGMEPFLVASSLSAVVAQRLVRTNCPMCSEAGEVDEESARQLALTNRDGLKRGKGCPNCRNSGFAGRTGVYEVLPITKAIQQLIESRAPESAIRLTARQEGGTSLIEDARRKVESGVTTADEVLRNVQVEFRGATCPGCAEPVEESFSVCPFCMHQLKVTCTCGQSLKKEWKSCPYCGAGRTPTAAPAPAIAAAPALTAAETAAAPAPPRTPAASPTLTSVPRTAPPSSSTAVSREVPPMGEIQKPRILIVDDNEDLRSIVRLTLERGPVPMDVDEASNGFEALGKVQAQRPHAIILDLMMPGMDGFEVCKRIRSDLQTAFIPILMLTAREDAESKSQGFLAGTDDYVTKPFNRPELLARVRRLLERTYGFGASPAATAAMEMAS
ncbi:MAG: type pilus assembly protein PilB [Candidatus Binatota bacterium]|nr:type pilus assembly protein PilB [Candidatus Binatota bacterium]